jgi:hypothetical protein
LQGVDGMPWNPAPPRRHRATCHIHTAQSPPTPAAHGRIKIRIGGRETPRLAVQRWVISPFDLAEHLLSDTPSTGGVLTTRCGRSLPDVANHPTPLIRRIRPVCEAMSRIADAPDSSYQWQRRHAVVSDTPSCSAISAKVKPAVCSRCASAPCRP